jgi:hypothetical protein
MEFMFYSIGFNFVEDKSKSPPRFYEALFRIKVSRINICPNMMARVSSKMSTKINLTIMDKTIGFQYNWRKRFALKNYWQSYFIKSTPVFIKFYKFKSVPVPHAGGDTPGCRRWRPTWGSRGPPSGTGPAPWSTCDGGTSGADFMNLFRP